MVILQLLVELKSSNFRKRCQDGAINRRLFERIGHREFAIKSREQKASQLEL